MVSVRSDLMRPVPKVKAVPQGNSARLKFSWNLKPKVDV